MAIGEGSTARTAQYSLLLISITLYQTSKDIYNMGTSHLFKRLSRISS
jgi:hypothetical protein